MKGEGTGKTALVTGGSRGIGRGIALAMAERGYDLAISHWQDGDNAEAASYIIRERFGRKCFVLESNLAEEDTPGRLADDAAAALGRIDVLVNNAGITRFSPITRMELSEINELLHLDFRAPVLLMRSVASQMIRRSIRGNIINITSTRSFRAYPTDAVYGGVKAALARATESIALELSTYGIRVNCIAPGAIQTTDERAAYYKELGVKIPLSRPGTPEDIGKAAVWLASEEASYVTGTTIRVDGGLILPGMPESVGDHNSGWGRI